MSIPTRRHTMIVLILLTLVMAVSGTAQEYLLGPGDVLDVAVLGESDLTRSVTVRSDGKISLPLVGEVTVIGLTPEQLQAKLTDVLRAYLKDPQVTVALSTARPLKIYIVGEVRSPGVYDLRAGWTVAEAIAQAGGLTEKAYLRKAMLIRRRTNQVVPLDLEQLILRGDQRANVALEDGDVIQVPQFQNQVLVLGQVRNPGAFDLKEGGRVLDAILAAGGPTDKARLAHVGVIRQSGDKAAVTPVNVALLLKTGDQTGNMVLQHADIVYVPGGPINWRDVVQWILDLTIVRSFLGAF